MHAFLAVVKQTLRAAFRSKVFHVLLILTLLAVFLLPLTVTSDGTASNELKLSITYSLTAVTALLSVAAVWLGGTGVSREIESYKLHMVRVKPIHPAVLWGGKWCAVFCLTGGIFLAAAAMIYGLIQYRIAYGDFSEDEIDKARQEVLTGRRVIEPQQPDYEEFARQRYQQMEERGQLPENESAEKILQDLRQDVRQQGSEVPFGGQRNWEYKNVNIKAGDKPAFVRYRLYVASTSEDEQRMTEGVWMIANPNLPQEEQSGVLPQRVVGGAHHEFSFPAEILEDAETFYIQYVNRDPENETVVFQPTDVPQIMVEVTGFTANWFRATVVVLLRLAVLAAVGCLFGVAFSPPVAVFIAIAYLVLGVTANPSIGTPLAAALAGVEDVNWFEVIAHLIAVTVDKIVVSLNAFDVSFLLAKGRLVELAHIARLLGVEVVLKGGLTAALGIWILNKRELGKVIRK
ncbi:MAG: ABC transporter permease [Lentisphaeria bacterium]